MLRDRELQTAGDSQSVLETLDEFEEQRERQERVRVATLSALFAAREVQITEEQIDRTE